MSTPIEIVRDCQREFEAHLGSYPKEKRDFITALTAVLRDAERFAALERAHNDPCLRQAWTVWQSELGEWEYVPQVATLAELADQLRKAQQ